MEAIKTAWGEVTASVAPANAQGTMPTDLEDLGNILQDSVSMETAEGTTLELRGTGAILLDQLQQEDTLTMNLTLIGVNKDIVDKFWKTTEGQNGILWVQSTVTSGKFALKLASKVVGSRTLLVPNASVKASLEYSEAQGWTMACAFTFIKAGSGNLLGFGTVAELQEG